MERHEVGEARVTPIILRPVDWQSAPFGKLQALPKNARPVTTWSTARYQHRPHPSPEAKRGQLRRVRRFLEHAGIDHPPGDER